ncbi:hypothetical protein BDY17DRAFT_327798 [Neohortaea acidophila]|uniref:Uncharacterized protein n=1 Tax=Neohortaea acidophila TaxID=245834 RepID=A0A6A6PG86_9PEZI|nr:uncharacterized protein BDY17DRAFT_327798 [Neohortaea acidophila]KAF2478990.1 hypothetical protein BDY17DRAFT_327798 [Neohortaea acidophila]
MANGADSNSSLKAQQAQNRLNPSSRTWGTARSRQNGQRQALNSTRHKFCPKSPFWHANFNLDQHKEEWEAGRTRHLALKTTQESRRSSSAPPPTTPRPFDGREFSTHHSPVLSLETVFSPTWLQGKEDVAPWPSKLEMKYEGDDRISTDRLHRRFLGIPRVEGNETVNWQHRAAIPQYTSDCFYYPIPSEEHIILRNHDIPGLQFTDEEGEEALGKAFMALLDPEDQW